MTYFLIMILFLTSCQAEQTSFAPTGEQRYSLTEKEREKIQKEQTFEYTGGEFEQKEFYINPNSLTIEKSLTLKKGDHASWELEQLVREKKSMTFTQGNSGILTEEQFNIDQLGLLDLLIVMDNSGSMGQFQTGVSKRLLSLLSALDGIRWQIAVTTTSEYDHSCLREAFGVKTINSQDYKNDPQLTEKIYSQLIQAGTDGSVNELGIKAATEAAIGDCGDIEKDWKREGSHLSVLIISDEGHCGSMSEEGCKGDPWDSSDYFFDHAPRPLDRLSVFGLFLLKDLEHTDDPLCPLSSGFNAHDLSEYFDLVNRSSGIYGEVCQKDYSQVLSRISQKVAENVDMEFSLSHTPIEDSIEVTLNGRPIPFDLRGNEVVLRDQLDYGTLAIRYRHSPRPYQHQVTLVNPDPTTIAVFENGHRLLDDLYEFQPTSNTLRLLHLVDDAHITITYKENIPLKKSFFLPLEEKGSIEAVFVDGSLLEKEAYSYDATTHSLQFISPPREGSALVIHYQPEGSIITHYPLAELPWDRIGSINVTDKASGEVISFSIENEAMIFPPYEVREGRVVDMAIDLKPQADDREFVLSVPDRSVASSIETEKDDICQSSLVGTRLSITCTEVPDKPFRVQFKVLVGLKTQFPIGQHKTPLQTAEVSIDGQITSEFSWEGKHIKINPDRIHPDSKIKITLRPTRSKEDS